MAESYIPHSEKVMLNLYALIAAGMILCCLPFFLMPFAGMACLTVGFISAYVYRFRNRHNAVIQFHSSYVIRTMWWSVVVLFIGVAVFACILVYNGDLTPINRLMEAAEKGVVPSESDVHAMQLTFVQMNRELITVAGAVCLLPYPLYVLVRVFKGVRMIKKRAET